jgi:cell division protein FtsQ
MSRSIADRSGIGRLARPAPAGARAPRAARAGAVGAARARTAGRGGWPLASPGRILPTARAAGRLTAATPRLRVALLGILLALALLAGGWMWLRDSPLVSVQRVQVSGIHGPEAGAIEAALVAAGRRMSTLDVHPGTLRAAVAPFAVVREVRASASFPHGLRIEVIEQLPVAALTVGGSRTAVAADGVVLGPGLLSSALPSLSGTYEPPLGQRLSSPTMLAPLAVLGAAPAAMSKLVTRVFIGSQGLTVVMRNGLQAFFGDATRPHAKWLSLARVLADPSSAGASYVDVRLPERPAAGFPAGVTPPAASSTGTSSSTGERTSASEAAVSALSARLTSSGGGASSAGGEAASSPTAARASSPSAQGQAPSGTPSEEASTAPTQGPEAAGPPGG